MDRTDDDEALRDLLSTPRRIAVVGASPKPERDSHRIFVLLKERGHDVLPINPGAGEVAGVQALPDLRSAVAYWEAPPDIVDVFRAPEHLPGVVDDAIAAKAKWLWCQFGVVNEQATKEALGAGMEVVVDRCIKVEIRRLGV